MKLTHFFSSLSFYTMLFNCLTLCAPCSATIKQPIPTTRLKQHNISYNDLKNSLSSSKNPLNSSRYHHRSCKKTSFKCFKESITIGITMTIPQMVGTVPSGANVDVTPFAIAPNGKITLGDPTNIVPSNALVAPLNSIVISHPLRGNYVIGYFITLGAGSLTFPSDVIANLSGVLLNNPVGGHTQTSTFPVQTLFFAPLVNPIDALVVTADFPVVHL